jgi:hypothetical protein
MWYVWEWKEYCARFWRESPKEKDHSEDRSIYGNGIRVDVREID